MKDYTYPTSKKFIDLTGKKYGKLSVLGFAYKKIFKSGTLTMWECVCECGNEICVSTSGLRSHGTSSCRCVNTKHGLSGQKMYKSWDSMKQRCYNPNYEKYDGWGGRGIKICDEWKNNFQAFHDWSMANGWKKGLEIERINNDGNYEPKNCIWATPKIQARNRRNTILNFGRVIVIRKLITLPNWNQAKIARLYGIEPRNVSRVILKQRWV